MMKQLSILLLLAFSILVSAQDSSSLSKHHYSPDAYTILPSAGILDFQPKQDSSQFDFVLGHKGVCTLTPLINFFFTPEGTINYKGAGQIPDSSHFNFYLRTDFGLKLGLAKRIDFVVKAQAFGTYTTLIGPLDKTLSLYEAYVDAKNIRNSGVSFKFGRQCLGKYGNELLVGDDDFIRGRSFESWRLRYQSKNGKIMNDLMWVQLYTQTNDTVHGAVWHHPVFFSSFNSFNIHPAINIDANLPFMVDQVSNGWRQWVLMPDLRVHGDVHGFRYSAEGIYQGGWAKGLVDESKRGSVAAYAAEVALGYHHKQEQFAIDASYYLASGDHNISDNKFTSFNVLWQNQHRRFGYIDVFKGSNVQAAVFHANLRATHYLDIGIYGLYARVLEANDASPAINNKSVKGALALDKTIGYGGSWYMHFYVNSFLAIQTYVAVMQPGKYSAEVNGINKPVIRMYLMAAVKI